MLKKFLSTTLLLLLFTSCISNSDYTTMSSENVIKVASVGDSITYGFSINDRKKLSYPSILNSYLGDDWIVKNFGVNGATLISDGDVPYIKTTNYKKVIAFQPDIIIIALGTNDTKPTNWISKEHFKNEYIKLLTHLKSMESNPQIIICTPIPAISNKWGIRDEIIKNEIISSIESICQESDYLIVDLYNTYNNSNKFYTDTIHPNVLGSSQIATTIYKYLANLET